MHRRPARSTLRLALRILLPAWPALVASASGQQTVNPAPLPAVQLPGVEVSAPKGPTPTKRNPLFDHPFANLRSAPLIEAIFWRHHYLASHPQEQALIVTTHEAEHLISATTVYTKSGKVYGSSNALGEGFVLKGMAAADLATAAGMARVQKYIFDLRIRAEDAGDPMVLAEETGNYSILGRAAGRAMPVDRHVPAQLKASMQQIRSDDNAAMRQSLTQAFYVGSSNEILDWTYQGLRDPARAGIVPVAMSQVGGQGAPVEVPPYAQVRRFQADHLPVLVFDWEGVQYYYQPDIGTWALPEPRNPITGLPYLCVRNGAAMECVYFCATYAKEYPDRKAVFAPGSPVLAAFQADDEKLGMFLPTMGRVSLPTEYLEAIDQPAYLGKLRDKFVAVQQQRGLAANPIPEAIAGDDGDMQMRRAWLAFQAAGISSRLEEDGPPSLKFTWNGLDYVYGSDQQIHPAEAPF